MLTEFVMADSHLFKRNDLEIHGGSGQESNENIKKFWKYVVFEPYISELSLYILHVSSLYSATTLYPN